jgi:hypothetical protein
MAQTRTLQVGGYFAAAATLGAYKASNWGQGQLPPVGAPLGSADVSATVQADTTVTFGGLSDNTDYFITDSSGSRYLKLRTTATSATGKGASVYDGSVSKYPARPSGFGSVEWVGPVDPATAGNVTGGVLVAQDGDTWINTA